AVSGLGFLVLAIPVVKFLLPARYAMTGWMLQILGLRVALDLFSAPSTSVILAHGESKYSAAGSTTRLLFMAAGIWFAFAHFGLQQAVYALVAAQALSYIPVILGLRKVLPEVADQDVRWFCSLVL